MDTTTGVRTEDTIEIKEIRASKPVSRILSPIRSGGDHSSSPTIADGIKRPTRELTSRVAGLRGEPPLLSYLVLLRVGFTLPPISLPGRCALTAPFHPYPTLDPGKPGENRAVYFLWHFPYRRRTLRRTGDPPSTLAVSEHTALWSSDFPLPRPGLPRQSWGARAEQRSPGLLAQVTS